MLKQTPELINRLICLCLLSLSVALGVLPAEAQEPPVSANVPYPALRYPINELTQVDRNGDGQPEETIIHTTLATEDDVVRVIDGGGDMQVSQDWTVATDFSNDLWVFDIGNNGDAQLIVQFQTSGVFRSALFYTDLNEDGVVSFANNGNGIDITEVVPDAKTPVVYPSITMEIRGDWFLPNRQLNYNVTFKTDGPDLRLRDSTDYSLNFTEKWDDELAMDGLQDTSLEIMDEDSNGIPESAMWRLLAGSPLGSAAVRTWIWRNIGETIPTPLDDFIFFPYLAPYENPNIDPNSVQGRLHVGVRPPIRRYFDDPPVIEVDWFSGRVTPPALRGYPIEQGAHVNTLNYFQPNRLNYANFENQQAYYDLADDHDRYPELHIRHRYFDAFDNLGWGLSGPVDEIRWSWNQSNFPDDVFDYKLSLAGRQKIEDTVDVGDYSYQTIPYDNLPSWVMNESWDIVTFIATEGITYRSTEGIYEWNTVERFTGGAQETISAYLTGAIIVDPGISYRSIRSGLRGEYSSDYKGSPYLYYSPIDQRLHLLKAARSVWNLAGPSEIRAYNLTGGDYLDFWTYGTDAPTFDENPTLQFMLPYWDYMDLPKPTRYLLQADNYLVYAQDNQVNIRENTTDRTLFTVQPPKDNQEWRALDALLNQYQAQRSALAPGNFAAAFNQFSGPELHLQNAQVRNFRAHEETIRFDLTVLPNYSISGSMGAAGDFSGLEPGDYVVTLAGSEIRVVPMTPPEVQVSISVQDVKEETAAPFSTFRVETTLQNLGEEDVKFVRVRLYAERTDFVPTPAPVPTRERDAVILHWYGTGPIPFSEQLVKALSGEPLVLTTIWTPPSNGDWRIYAQVEPLKITLPDTFDQPDEPGEFFNPTLYFDVSNEALNNRGENLVTTDYKFTVLPLQIEPQIFLSLADEQPLGGALVIILLGLLALIAVGVFGLIVQRTD